MSAFLVHAFIFDICIHTYIYIYSNSYSRRESLILLTEELGIRKRLNRYSTSQGFEYFICSKIYLLLKEEFSKLNIISLELTIDKRTS